MWLPQWTRIIASTSQPAPKSVEALACPFAATDARDYDDHRRRTFSSGEIVALVDNNNVIEAVAIDGSGNEFNIGACQGERGAS
jgi:hypothetical protein